MTNYDERLDEIFAPLIDSPSLTLTTAYWDEAKAAITSLIKELVEEAKPAMAIISDEEMYNPENNVAKAFEIWKAQSYTAWSVYTNGKYLNYI